MVLVISLVCTNILIDVLTITIKQIGNSNETDDTGDMKFKGSNMTLYCNW